MCECKQYKQLAAKLEAARKAKDWEKAKSLTYQMADHVAIMHPEYNRNYGLASAFVTKARGGSDGR